MLRNPFARRFISWIRLLIPSVNPARSFGPAIFVGGDALSSLWVFILAPLVGGVLAALVYKFLAGKKD